MKKQDLVFKINGSIHFREENTDSNHFDKEIFHQLEKERYSIEQQIKDKISKELDKDIDIEIRFEKGSIIIEGIVIIKWISIVGGVFSFIDYASRVVKRIISGVLENRIRRNSPRQIRPFIIISTSSNSSKFKVSKTRNLIDNVSNPFTLRTILITITLFNIILFLGGSIQGLFTVQSLKDQYVKSKEELLKINSELTSTSYEIKSNQEKVKLELESLPYKLEKKYSRPVEIKRDSIIIELNRIGGDLRILNNEIEAQKEIAKAKIENIPIKFENEFLKPLKETRDSLNLKISNLNNDIFKLNTGLSKQNRFYNDSTMTLVKLLSDNKDKKDIRIGFKDLNWTIIIALGFSFINLLLIGILFLIRKIK